MHPFNVIRLKSVDSTNSWAKNAYAQQALPANTVIVAETQTAGRGQMLTKWHDEPGKNLLFTLVFAPKRLRADQHFKLNAAISIALANALEPFVDVQIKWPNDIVADGKKLAGLLIETNINGGHISYVFAGIGLNVNQLVFPEGLRATSLKLHSGQDENLDDLLFSILSNVHQAIQNLNDSQLLNTYNNCLFGSDQLRIFNDKNGPFSARVLKVDEHGVLHLEVPNESEPRTYRFKEVTWQLASE